MRLPLLPCVFGLAAALVVPLAAQPSRSVAAANDSAPPAAPDDKPVVEWWRDGGPRIRPTDERVAAMLRAGVVRSRTLRELVDAVEAGDVIVYIGMEPRLREELAGSVRFSGSAGKYRYLRAGLSRRLSGEALTAALAHELQHVVEVVNHPEVDSEPALTRLYRRIGHATRTGTVTGWDTLAAQRIGDDVRRELLLGGATALARRAPNGSAAAAPSRVRPD